jgi:tetratricopeptide (TPR) repeat protein
MVRNFLATLGAALLVVAVYVPATAQTHFVDPNSQTIGQLPSQAAPAISPEDLAKLYMIRKQFREAAEVFERLTREHPKNAVYWNELGITYQNLMELRPALKCYEKATKIDSHYPDAQNNAGTVWYEMKRYPKAIRAYKRAISLQSEFASFYLNLGYAYFGHKEYEDSLAAFHQALVLDPDAFGGGRSRGGTIIQDRSLDSDRGYFYYLLAKSFAESGNVERSLAYLRKARDEGYTDWNKVKTDPTFALVLKDPTAQEVLAPPKPAETAQP